MIVTYMCPSQDNVCCVSMVNFLAVFTKQS
jgi:hypothetical protein